MSAYDGQKKGEVLSKDEITCKISSILFQKLAEHSVPTHYIKSLGKNEILAKKLRMIPIEVVVRNRVAGSLVRKLGLHKGDLINNGKGIVEFYYKSDKYNDPLITEDHVFLLGLLQFQRDLEAIKVLAFQINVFLQSIFRSINVSLVDFKLEFGFDSGNDIILGDEITPDTCRLWDSTTNEVFDKDVFRKDLGDLKSSYQDLLKRLVNYIR